MRIIAGKYGGRPLHTPADRSIRPTSDKIRGAIFNMLQARKLIEGAHALDVFCGTGALGLEALSRGACFCTFIDHDKVALDLTRRNVASLKAMDESDFILRDACNLAPRPEFISRATLVFLDPPYKKNLIEPALKNLGEQGWLAPRCACIFEMESSYRLALPEGFNVETEKLYGRTKITLAAAP